MDRDENSPSATATTKAVNPALKNTLRRTTCTGAAAASRLRRLRRLETVVRPADGRLIERNRHIRFAADAHFASGAGRAFLEVASASALVVPGVVMATTVPPCSSTAGMATPRQIEALSHGHGADVLLACAAMPTGKLPGICGPPWKNTLQ